MTDPRHARFVRAIAARRAQPERTREQALNALLGFLRHTDIAVADLCTNHPQLWNAYLEANRDPAMLNKAEARALADIHGMLRNRSASPER